MIFRGVQDGKPYSDHGFAPRDWAQIPPRQIRLDQVVTITSVLALDKLLAEDSTFYGDLFAHVVQFQGELYLEDGLHRAVRSALRGKNIIHARVLNLDEYLATGTKPGESGQLYVSPTAVTPEPGRPANPRRTSRRGAGGSHRA